MGENKEDGMLKLCIQQGYVPSHCVMDGRLVFAMISSGVTPCAGCNMRVGDALCPSARAAND